MHSETLEKDLQEYAVNPSPDLFSLKLYAPLCQLFKWICSNQYSHLGNADFEDVQQQVMLYVIKKFKYYRKGKGMSAVSYVRMLIGQELHLRKREIDRDNLRQVAYDVAEDNRHYTPPDDNSNSIYQEKLTAYQSTVPYRYRKVIGVLIQALSDAKVCKLNYADKIAYFSRKSKVSNRVVLKVIKDIKQQQFFRDNGL